MKAKDFVNETEMVGVPHHKHSDETYYKVPKYWYHNPMHRGFTNDGGIAAYDYHQRGASDDDNLLFKQMVYLSPKPLGPSAKIDITKLPNFNNKTFVSTGQAEGYHIYRGSIPAEAIVEYPKED